MTPTTTAAQITANLPHVTARCVSRSANAWVVEPSRSLGLPASQRRRFVKHAIGASDARVAAERVNANLEAAFFIVDGFAEALRMEDDGLTPSLARVAECDYVVLVAQPHAQVRGAAAAPEVVGIRDTESAAVILAQTARRMNPDGRVWVRRPDGSTLRVLVAREDYAVSITWADGMTTTNRLMDVTEEEAVEWVDLHIDARHQANRARAERGSDYQEAPPAMALVVAQRTGAKPKAFTFAPAGKGGRYASERLPLALAL